MEIKSNLIGAVVLTSNMKSDFSHFDDEEEDGEVQGIIIERIDDSTTTIYLIMSDDGRVYQAEYNEIEKIISFGGLPHEYLKKKKYVLGQPSS